MQSHGTRFFFVNKIPSAKEITEAKKHPANDEEDSDAGVRTTTKNRTTPTAPTAPRARASKLGDSLHTRSDAVLSRDHDR